MDEPERTSIALVMLPGNLECLLENTIPVESISLKAYGDGAVILMLGLNADQKIFAQAIGFKTTDPRLENG